MNRESYTSEGAVPPVRSDRLSSAGLVVIASTSLPLPLCRGALPRGFQPSGLGCSARRGWLSLLPEYQGGGHGSSQPLGHIVLVPQLAPRAARHQPQLPLSVQPASQLLKQC